MYTVTKKGKLLKEAATIAELKDWLDVQDMTYLKDIIIDTVNKQS